MPKEADPMCDGDSSSADEGDNNKSFVKKVKSHVTGFLPTTLSKWLGAKSRQRDELDDDEDAYQLQPPPKRVKTHNLDFDMNNIATPLHSQLRNPFSQEFREPVPGPSVTTRKLVLPASNHYNQNQPDQTNGIDSDSGESTSGYSSMPRIGSKEHVSELPGHSNAQAHHSNSSIAGNKSIFNTSIPLERSLFGEHFVSQKKSNTSLSSRRPSFNASAFGAPNFMDKTLSTRRIFNSPFYSGRITYGGASAYNRSILNASPDQVPQSPTVQPKLVNGNKSAALSKTAKRILDTLEQYTSPAQDVRRIPTDRRTQRPEGLIGKYVGANPYTVREVPKLPSNKELQVPTMSDLLKMKLKERLQDSTSSMREIASHSSSPLNAEEYSIRNNELDKQGAGKSTNKIKTKVSSVRQKCMPDDEMVPEVKLPDVQLPISTLPSFNFSIPFSKPETALKTVDDRGPSSSRLASASKSSGNSSSTSSAIATPTINFKNPDVPSKPFASASPVSKINALPKLPTVLQETKKLVQDTATSSNVEFKFAKPLVIAENKFKSIKAINNFKFSDPLVKKALNGLPVIKKVVDVPDSRPPLPKSGFGDMFKVGADKWECTACMVRNISTATTCISCTTPKASTKPTANGPSTLAPMKTASSWGDKFKAPSNSWTCTVCMISNDVSKEKCAACESPKPSAISAPTTTTKVISFESFTKKTDGWECPSCMVNNATTKDKCVCCETPKPGAKLLATAPAPLKPPAISSWGDKFKAPSTTWECSMCMIRNNVDKEKCVACENPRPVGIAAPKGVDGFKKDSEWECTNCMVRNPSSKDKCVCCEASKPGSKPVPSAQVRDVPKFSFGIENGLINGQGFMFGIPTGSKAASTEVKKSDSTVTEKTNASSSSTPNAQFLFGIKSPNGAKTSMPTNATETENTASESNKASSVPTFSFGIPAGSKRSAPADEPDTAKAPRKADSDSSSNLVLNGNLNKTDTVKTDLQKFTFRELQTAPESALMNNSTSSLFDTSASKPTDPRTRTFGVKSSTPTVSFAFAASPATTAAASVATKSDAKAVPAPTTFGTLDKPVLASSPPALFTFNTDASSASAATPIFNTSASFTNGSAATFNFAAAKTSAKPAEPSAIAFKFTDANSAKPTSFGSSTPTPTFNMFAGAASTSSTNSVFGGAAPQNASTFGSNMTFGSNNAAPVTFGAGKAASQPSFGSPGPPPPYGASSTNTFGKSTPNGVFNFGAGSSQANDAKPAMNFGVPAAASSSGGFSFGASVSAPNTNGAFNFGGNSGSDKSLPTFSATAKPTINFTAGVPTTAFSAQPLESKAPPARVIRRAVRRTQR